MTPSIGASTRKKVLRVVFISLLLDLVSFTFILPLLPALLAYYRDLEAPPLPSTLNSNHPSCNKTLLANILYYLHTFKVAFARPIDSRYDIVLLGGALGSLFSFLQAIASPLIGTLSDRHGRRTALLTSMVGNIASLVLWLLATDFNTFLLSRIVAGLSEGNVQLAIAIATDISDEKQRGSTMALIGICFSISFTFGPALGSILSTINLIQANPFAAAAGVSLLLILIETVYLYLCLPETLPYKVAFDKTITTSSDSVAIKNFDTQKPKYSSTTLSNPAQNLNGSGAPSSASRTNSHFLINFIHLAFLLFFSGMEFSLPFMTYDLFRFTSALNGRLLGYMGLVASLIQGQITRRISPLLSVRIGTSSCLLALLMLSRINTIAGLYLAATLLAVTSATVVTGLNTLSSFEAAANERGVKLGLLRSWGQLGRAVGPLLFTCIYWWAGREFAYTIGSMGMLGVVMMVFFALR